MDVGRGPEDLVAQAGIQGQPWAQSYVVLQECGEVRVALVFAEHAGRAGHGKQIALRTSVLGRALAEEEIRKAEQEKKAIVDERHVDVDLVAFDFSAEAEAVHAMR